MTLTDAQIDELNYSVRDFSRDVALTLDEMRKRLRQLEAKIQKLEEAQSNSTATAKLKLVHDGHG